MSNKKRHYYNNGKNRNRSRFQSEKVSINKVYDSNGPSGRQRGNASTLYEKYVTLARDASVSGDRVLSENYMQHAEHYLRIVHSIQEQMQSAYQAAQANEPQSDTPIDDQAAASNDQPSIDETSAPQSNGEPKEAPVIRRKTYPYARRRSIDSVKPTDSTSIKSEENVASAPVIEETVSIKEVTPAEEKPKRTVRRRTVTKKVADTDTASETPSE